MTSETILLEETRNGVRFLRMNRPETKNSLSNDSVRALIRGFEAAASDDGLVEVGPCAHRGQPRGSMD